VFGWNYYPEIFGEQLLQWIKNRDLRIETAMDLGCGTGVLCEILREHGVCASGMDFSSGMIDIARERCPEIHYEVADMITFRPDRQFDLVTCTGDALNHIAALSDVEAIFRNVHHYTRQGGYFIFDILNEGEVNPGEPFDLDFDETIRAQFMITRNSEGIINLKTSVYENGELQFEENITETVHDPEMICALLRKSGFEVLQCSNRLLDDAQNHGTTWFIIARKSEKI
jgi:SAM-dependent methyltransferase